MATPKNPPVTHLGHLNTGHSWLEPKEAAAPPASGEFPKRKYHELETNTVVQSPDEEKALGAGWHDSPVAAAAAAAKNAPPAEKK